LGRVYRYMKKLTIHFGLGHEEQSPYVQ